MIGLPRVYVGKCAGSESVGRLRKRFIDTMNFKEKRFGCHARIGVNGGGL